MDSVHLGQAAHAPPVYRMVPPYNFEKLHLPHLLTPVPVRLEAAAGYRLPGVRGWGHFRGSKRPQVGPVQRIVLTRGKIRADVVHERLLAMGFSGNERTTRRAVAELKAAYRAGHRRSYRPWLPEPGMWLQFDWGEGPRVGGRRTHLFCAWLAWSRY